MGNYVSLITLAWSALNPRNHYCRDREVTHDREREREKGGPWGRTTHHRAVLSGTRMKAAVPYLTMPPSREIPAPP